MRFDVPARRLPWLTSPFGGAFGSRFPRMDAAFRLENCTPHGIKRPRQPNEYCRVPITWRSRRARGNTTKKVSAWDGIYGYRYYEQITYLLQLLQRASEIVRFAERAVQEDHLVKSDAQGAGNVIKYVARNI